MSDDINKEMSRKLASGKSPKQIVLFEKRFEIPDYDNPAGPPSRIRWRLLHTPWFGIYVHKWLQPDPRPTLHDHPWPFLSLILRGGYVEKTIHGIREVKWANWTSKHKFHTVTKLMRIPTWSLMFVGKTGPTWGYLDSHTWIPFDKHPHSDEFSAALKARQLCTDSP